MIYPSGDTIEQKVGSRYSLVVIAAKRAKQIKEGAPVLIDTESTNPLTIAMEEIAAGKVSVLESSMTPAPDARATHDEADAPTDDPRLIEAQSAAALDKGDPEAERPADADTSDEQTA